MSSYDELHEIYSVGGRIRAVGTRGLIRRFVSEMSWISEDLMASTVEFMGVWGVSEPNWLVGKGGALYYLNGATKTSITTGTTVDFNALTGNATTLWVVGSAGTLLTVDSALQRVMSNTKLCDQALSGIWLEPTGQLWASGEAGTILRH